MDNVILIRYGEIHLKGKNRPYFESMLKKSIISAAKIDPDSRVSFNDGRYYIEGYSDKNKSKLMNRISSVFGVHSLSPAVRCPKELDAIYSCVAGTIDEYNIQSGTFKIEARRSDKRFELNSMQIAAEMGARVLEQYKDLKVNVVEPENIIYIEVRSDYAYVYHEIIKGPGGMPIGSSGSAMLLLSGGIDSPVAGYLMAKRGLSIQAVHFYSFPYTSERAKRKVLELAEIMSSYCGNINVHMAPFTQIQESIYEKCKKQYITIIMRRFMMAIAQEIAIKNGCGALITGESLGQVASQTLLSLKATNSAVDMLVMRPLIGMDKVDIMYIARKIGTYETSILPYEDCCTVFVPKHPATRPDIEDVINNEGLLDKEMLISRAVESIETITVS